MKTAESYFKENYPDTYNVLNKTMGFDIFSNIFKGMEAYRNQEPKGTVYVPVKCSERLPVNSGWFLMCTDAFPAAMGRCWFDGKEFKTSKQRENYAGLLANGWQLFWLEETTFPIADIAGKEGQKVIVINKIARHEFDIGEIVTLIKKEPSGLWKACNQNKGNWWVDERDVRPASIPDKRAGAK